LVPEILNLEARKPTFPEKDAPAFLGS
jgi:hypothetical protein